MLAPEDHKSVSFITSDHMFCFVAMPFGLKNAGATYQRLVDKIFRHQLGRNMEVYVDGMLVKVKEAHNHAEDLEETFAVLRKYRLKLNIGKCAFGVRRTFSGIYGDPTRYRGQPSQDEGYPGYGPSTNINEERLTRMAALNRFIS
ncbi:UNVERIFIED_CONTAM: Retrovirus-related Pol polyprotein from transposon.6 [Sesamum angustifolium]|uniref:Retrovirus-related Pol polyprotein from transposon.6 n=1 Tax=Sesamum angustifolium TaxID=2727405 RepID=A0AAW2JJW6_9LAMI